MVVKRRRMTRRKHNVMIEQLDPIEEEYQKALFRWVDYSTSQFDKGIFYVSSGALALSFTFLEKFIKKDQLGWEGFLITSWILFAIVIIIHVANHYLSARSMIHAIEKCRDEEYESHLNKYLRYANVASIVLLFLALIFMIIFVYLNFKR